VITPRMHAAWRAASSQRANEDFSPPPRRPARRRRLMLWRQKREPVRVTREITISNKHGFHARPAAEFFRSEITLTRNGERFSATSLMDILRGQFECGATCTLEAYGPDAQDAVDALCAVLVKLREQEAAE
jgi:phosphotransferase system HPr (HPr) family protein